jgi:serine/threonine protein kinase
MNRDLPDGLSISRFEFQPNNILVEVPDPHGTVEAEQVQPPSPAPAILSARPLAISVDSENLTVKISDLGVGNFLCLAHSGNWVDNHWLEMVQHSGYRAPEVILQSRWSTPVDIWSFGCVVGIRRAELTLRCTNF